MKLCLLQLQVARTVHHSIPSDLQLPGYPHLLSTECSLKTFMLIPVDSFSPSQLVGRDAKESKKTYTPGGILLSLAKHKRKKTPIQKKSRQAVITLFSNHQTNVLALDSSSSVLSTCNGAPRFNCIFPRTPSAYE